MGRMNIFAIASVLPMIGGCSYGGCSYGWTNYMTVTQRGGSMLVDTSAMPEGSVRATIESRSGSKLGQTANIYAGVPIRIVILPATQPASSRAIEFVGTEPYRKN